MKNSFLLFLATFFIAAGYAQPGYEISIQLKPYANSQIYLGYHYGKVRALADSAMLNSNAMGVFKGKETLPGGIYFIVSPSKQILFEILIDKDQRFSVVADSAKLPEGIVFTGTLENQQFQDYSAYAGKMGKEISLLNSRLAQAKTHKDSVDANLKNKLYTGRLQQYRDSITKKYPESFLSALFLAMNDPKIPTAAEQPGGKYDSNFVYEYYKEHYWDGISFTDNRLVRTPFFEGQPIYQ